MSSRAPISPVPAAAADPETEARLRRLEAEVAAIRQDIAAAIAAQEQLHAQLKPAVEKLEQLLRQRSAAAIPPATSAADPAKNSSQQIGRLESRVRAIEQRLERVAGQVSGILESRIWRTLVKGGSIFLRLRH